MGRGRLCRIATLFGAVAIVAGCDTIGNPFEVMGAKKPTPDEFAVVSRAPLVMPGSRDLPEPTPGTASPLDPNPQAEAFTALAGSPQPSLDSNQVSRGETVLLTSANAAASSPDIRVQLEQDEVDALENEPYEPPSLGELFFGSGDGSFDEEDMLDPNEESRRLQTTGLTAPVDPNEEVPVDPNADDGSDELDQINEISGRPENKLYQTVPKY